MASMTERLMEAASERSGLRTKISLIDPESGKTILRGRTPLLQFALQEYTTENVLEALQGFLIGVSFRGEKGNIRTKTEGVVSIDEIKAEWHPEYVPVPQLPAPPTEEQKALPAPGGKKRGRPRKAAKTETTVVPVSPPVPETVVAE